MTQSLFLVLFLTGIIPVIPYRYFVVQQGKTWSDAQAYCQSNSAQLASIQSSVDVAELQIVAQLYQFTADAWFGAYKTSHAWRWSYGNEILGATTNWGTNQPNNIGNNEECVAIGPDGTWWDTNCAFAFPFVCYYALYTGSYRYIYIFSFVDWYEAQSYCRLYYTDLASARDATENSDISGKVSSYTWIGLSRVTWQWADQTNLASINWKPGQPDNFRGYEDCGYLSTFQPADARCSDLKPFFCQRPDEILTDTTTTTITAVPLDATAIVLGGTTSPTGTLGGATDGSILGGTANSTATGYNGTAGATNSSGFSAADKKIQTLNIKVQSAQNMNDPAVKAALLEKIRQKLKEHGLEQNITLKWKEQPSGEVFHKIEDDEIDAAVPSCSVG